MIRKQLKYSIHKSIHLVLPARIVADKLVFDRQIEGPSKFWSGCFESFCFIVWKNSDFMTVKNESKVTKFLKTSSSRMNKVLLDIEPQVFFWEFYQLFSVTFVCYGFNLSIGNHRVYFAAYKLSDILFFFKRRQAIQIFLQPLPVLLYLGQGEWTCYFCKTNKM